MKKALMVLLSILIVLSSMVVSGAKNAVEFSFDTESVLEDRLFDIDVTADKSSLLCGGEVVVSLDSDFAEYRSIESENYYVEAVPNGDNLHIVFASSYPADSGSCFDINLKSVSEGNFDITLKNIQCVDENLENIDVNSKVSEVVIESKGVTVKSKSSKAGKSSSDKTSVKAERSKIIKNEDKDESSKGFVNIAKEQGNKHSSGLVICVIGLLIIFIFLMVSFLKKPDAESDKMNPEDVDTSTTLR